MTAGAIVALCASVLAIITSGVALLVRFAKFVGLETQVEDLKKEQKRSAESTGKRLEKIVLALERIDTQLEERSGRPAIPRRKSQLGIPAVVVDDDDSDEEGR